MTPSALPQLISGLPSASQAAFAALGLFAGLLLGFIHFGGLRWNASLYAGGSPLRAFALQIGRFAIVVVSLGALARFGALPLLASTLGMVLTRGLILRRVGRLP